LRTLQRSSALVLTASARRSCAQAIEGPRPFRACFGSVGRETFRAPSPRRLAAQTEYRRPGAAALRESLSVSSRDRSDRQTAVELPAARTIQRQKKKYRYASL